MAGSKMIVAMVTMMAVVGMAAAASHVVGDSTGWIVPPSSSLYTTWAAKQKIQTGDVLVFNFQTNAHTVAEVSKSDYDACTFTKPLSTATNGPANMTVKTAGTHYYVCTVGTHCQAGQKLAVTVTAAGSSSAPKTSPSAAPAASPSTSTTSPSPSTTESPAGTPSSSPASDMGPSAAAGPSGSAASPPSGNSAPSAGIGAAGLAFFPVLIAAVFLH